MNFDRFAEIMKIFCFVSKLVNTLRISGSRLTSKLNSLPACMNWNKLSQICCECNFWQYKTNDFAKIRFVNFATMIFQCNGTPLRHQTRPTSNITKKVPILNFRPIGIKWTETQTTSWTCTTPRGIKNSRTGLGRSGGRTFYDSWQWGLEWGPFSIPGP